MNGSYIQNNMFQNNDIEDSVYDMNNISQVLLKKSYFIFYFEIHYFMLWNAEYIRTVYPENNLIALLSLNDDFDTQEKIFLVKSDEKSKFIPLLKKTDIDKVKNNFNINISKKLNYSLNLFENKIKKLKINIIYNRNAIE